MPTSVGMEKFLYTLLIHNVFHSLHNGVGHPDPHGTSSKGQTDLCLLSSLFLLFVPFHVRLFFLILFAIHSSKSCGGHPDPHGTSSKGQTDLYLLSSLFLLFVPFHVRLFFLILFAIHSSP